MRIIGANLKAFSFTDKLGLRKALPRVSVYCDKAFRLSETISRVFRLPELNVPPWCLILECRDFCFSEPRQHIVLNEQLKASFPQAGVLLHTPLAFVQRLKPFLSVVALFCNTVCWIENKTSQTFELKYKLYNHIVSVGSYI